MTSTSLAAAGFSTFSHAQSTAVAVPERTELRRGVPIASMPLVQQSPNGLYKLSITDAGIELRGPTGVVKITNAGIVIGEPNTARVEIHSGRDMFIKAGSNVRVYASGSMDIRSESTMGISAGSTLDLRSAREAFLVATGVRLGCPSGRQVARLGD